MIRRARYFLAAAGTAAVLAGGMSLAGAEAASAQPLPLPTCPGSHCASNLAGAAGYWGADDNHTRYRYVTTVTTATPQLTRLNGVGPFRTGAVGVELCDPNNVVAGFGFGARLDLSSPAPGVYNLTYAAGFFAPAADPCVQNGLVSVPISAGKPLGLNGVSSGDQIFMAIYYTPTPGPNFHRISFGVCDITTNVCRQAYGPTVNLNFWEFGIGAAANHASLTAPAINPLDGFASNQVTCYSCAGAVPITSVQPVNPFQVGGLSQAQFVNISAQVTMSPNNSLSASSDDFAIWNGSTTP